MGNKNSGRHKNPTVSDIAPNLDSSMVLPAIVDIGKDDTGLDIGKLPSKALAILTLKAMGYSQDETARALKISQPTVHDYIHRYDPNGVFTLSTDTLQNIALSKWYGLEQQALDQARGKMSQASVGQAVMAAGIARDKQHKALQLAQERQAQDRAADALAGIGKLLDA